MHAAFYTYGMWRIGIVAATLLFALPLHAQSLSCDIWSSKSTYVPGETATFHWMSTNARSASIDGVGPVAPSGYWRTQVQQSGSVTLRVRGNNGAERICRTNYTVRAQRPTCRLNAVPLSVARDSFVTLSWSTQYASSVSISGLGQVPATGSRVVRADRTNTYTLVAVGEGGSCTQPATVQVQSPYSSYGYFPVVANSIAGPLFGYTYPRETYYFDTYYEPVYESVWYESVYAWDDPYVVYEESWSDPHVEYEAWEDPYVEIETWYEPYEPVELYWESDRWVPGSNESYVDPYTGWDGGIEEYPAYPFPYDEGAPGMDLSDDWVQEPYYGWSLETQYLEI